MASTVAVPASGSATSPRSVCDSHFAAHKKRVVEVQLGTRTPKGDYCLIYELGKGGNGVVYLGQSIVDSTRFRAVKVTKNVARNMKEYTAMTNFDHPNVVKVDDLQITEDGSLMMIIMEVKSKVEAAFLALRLEVQCYGLFSAGGRWWPKRPHTAVASTTKRRAHRNTGGAPSKHSCSRMPLISYPRTRTLSIPPVLTPLAAVNRRQSPSIAPLLTITPHHSPRLLSPSM